MAGKPVEDYVTAGLMAVVLARDLSVHPGHSVEEVIAKTGFELIMPPRVPETQSTTDEEMRVLRTQVDPQGVLRRLRLT